MALRLEPIVRVETSTSVTHKQASMDDVERRLDLEKSPERRLADCENAIAESRINGDGMSNEALPSSPEDGDEHCDCEVSLCDPDEMPQEDVRQTRMVSYLLSGESGCEDCFLQDIDSIHIVNVGGVWKCLVDDDLGLLFATARKGGRLEKLQEPVRTKVLRQISKWIEQNCEFESIEKLQGCVRGLQYKDIVDEIASSKGKFDKSTFSRTMKYLYLVWDRQAIAFRDLFRQCESSH